MERMLCPLTVYATTYIDIIIDRNDWQWNRQHLRTVLRSLRYAEITEPKEACNWRVEVWCLGFHMVHAKIVKTAMIMACSRR